MPRLKVVGAIFKNFKSMCIDDFRIFCNDVKTGKTPSITSCTPASARECLDLLDKSTAAMKFFNERGLPSKRTGKGDARENGFTFSAGEYRFTVHPVNAKKQTIKKGVADSSREAYHSIDTRPQTFIVAKAAIELAKENGFVTDSLVAKYIGIPPSTVSARRNEIESLAGVMVGSEVFYFEMMGRKPCPVSKRSVNAWRLNRVENEVQGRLFDGI